MNRKLNHILAIIISFENWLQDSDLVDRKIIDKFITDLKDSLYHE